MSVFFEEWNAAAVDASLEVGPYHPRITVHVQAGGETFRFIRDNVERTMDGKQFLRLPYLEVGPVENTEGAVADRVELSIDGSDLFYPDSTPTETAFAQAMAKPLRGAPIQIGKAMLDRVTRQPIGFVADFVGFIEGAEMDMDGPAFTVTALSSETWFHQRAAEVYTDVSHQRLWPGDNAFRHVSDTVNRGGNALWNGRESGSSGSPGIYNGPTPDFTGRSLF